MFQFTSRDSRHVTALFVIVVRGDSRQQRISLWSEWYGGQASRIHVIVLYWPRQYWFYFWSRQRTTPGILAVTQRDDVINQHTSIIGLWSVLAHRRHMLEQSFNLTTSYWCAVGCSLSKVPLNLRPTVVASVLQHVVTEMSLCSESVEVWPRVDQWTVVIEIISKANSDVSFIVWCALCKQ